MLDEKRAHVVHVGHLQAGAAEQALQGQLDTLLRPPHRQVPDAVALIALGLGEDQTRLTEMTARDLLARHSSMISPGWNSRFKTQ